MIGIFFIATKWGRNNGGINSVNYALISHLADIVKREYFEYKIFCILTDNNQDDDELFNIEQNKNIEFVSSKSPIKSPKIEILIKQHDFDFMFFIGHDIITGKIAIDFKDKYKNSKSIIFHHMDYKSYYYLREDNPQKIRDKENLQQQILPLADIILAIGPLLKESAEDKIIDAQFSKTIVEELIPGLENITPNEKDHNKHTIILFGRIEEKNNKLKLIPLALDAISSYINKNPRMREKIIVRCYGYADDSEENQKEVLEETFELSKCTINITANKYIENEDELFKVIANSSLCIMPSLAEGFGLVAYEAIAAGVPVIITKNTGIYKFLLNKEGDPICSYVKSIDIQGNPSPDKPYTETDLENLVQCIEDIFSNYNINKKNALRIREVLLKEHYTWEYFANNFISIINEHTPTGTETQKLSTLIEVQKKNISISEYILNTYFPIIAACICNPNKVKCKIIKYSNNRERRFTILSWPQTPEDRANLKTRSINSGTVGIMNKQYIDCNEKTIILSDFTANKCYKLCVSGVTEVENVEIGSPDHHVLAILAIPLVYRDTLVGALTFDIFDEEFISKLPKYKIENSFENNIFTVLDAFSKILTDYLYYQFIDNLNFSEVNKMLKKRELVSFSGKCLLGCKHCFAQELEHEVKENEVMDIIESLKDKSFDIIYISHFKENFFNPTKGIELCEKIFDTYKCDIFITTRCTFNGEPLMRLNKLNKAMRENGHNLTLCVSIPAMDSYRKTESSELIPTPMERINFAKKVKSLGIYSFITIRPLFPQNFVPLLELQKIVDECENDIDAILTGGLCVTDAILQKLELSDAGIHYLADEKSEYLQGVSIDFRHIDVSEEVNFLASYCKSKNIPFFNHSMDALNYFK